MCGSPGLNQLSQQYLPAFQSSRPGAMPMTNMASGMRGQPLGPWQQYRMPSPAASSPLAGSATGAAGTNIGPGGSSPYLPQVETNMPNIGPGGMTPYAPSPIIGSAPMGGGGVPPPGIGASSAMPPPGIGTSPGMTVGNSTVYTTPAGPSVGESPNAANLQQQQRLMAMIANNPRINIATGQAGQQLGAWQPLRGLLG